MEKTLKIFSSSLSYVGLFLLTHSEVLFSFFLIEVGEAFFKIEKNTG
jgi:hypothetical protein